MPSANIYGLSIRVFPDGFSFVATEGGRPILYSRKSGLARRELLPALQQAVQEQVPAQGNVAGRLIVHAPVFTLVPTPLYQPENAQSWLRFFQTDIKEYNIVREDELLPFGCVNVYAISGALADFARSFGQLEVRHSLSHLLLEHSLPSKEQGNSAVFLYAAPATLDVAVLEAGRLALANSFAYTAPADVLYHVLNVYERFHLPVGGTVCYMEPSESGRDAKKLLEQYVDLKTL